MVRALALVAVAVLLLQARAAQARTGEVIVPELPEGSFQLVAAGDGAAWLLARDRPGRPGALWRIDPAGEGLRRVALPTPSPPDLIAASGEGEIWAAGYGWVATIGADGETNLEPLEERGLQDLAVLGPGRAVLSRPLRIPRDASTPVTEVVLFHQPVRGGRIRPTVERFTGHYVVINSLVPDGHGGFWAYFAAKAADGRWVTGYLHRDEGGWGAWVPRGVWPDFVQAPPGLRVMGATPPEVGWGGAFAVPDGAGGFYADADRRQLYRVAGDGTAQAIPAAGLGRRGNLEMWNDVASDPPALLILTGGARDTWHPRGPGERVRLTWFDGQQVTRTERVPLPRWGTAREWPRGDLAVGGGVQWMAYSGLVMRRSGASWTSFSSRRMMDRVARERRQRRSEVAIWILGTLLGAALSVGGGALLVGTLGRRPVAGVAAQIVAGGGLALPATVLTLAVNPLVEPWDKYGIAAVMFMVGCLAAWGLATIGTYVAGAWRRPALAFAAAALGSATGITAAIFADGGLHDLLDHLPFETRSFRWATAAGLVGLFATIGAQLSGGTSPREKQAPPP